MAAEEEGPLDEQPVRNYSRWKLYFAVLGASSLFIVVGVFQGWPSPAIPKLKHLHVPENKITLLASLPSLAPGPLIVMFAIDVIGRKRTMLVSWCILLSSWGIVCLSDEINALLVARFIGGWGMAATYSAICMYISEISDVAVRGALNSLSLFFIGIGSLIMVCFGPFISFSALTALSTAVSLIFGLFYFFMPESPHYYVLRGNMDRALSVLLWLRNDTPKKHVDEELIQIQLSIEEERKHKTGIRKLFTSKVVFKQFTVSFFLLLFQQATALAPIGAFTQTLFEDAKLNFDAAYVPIGLSTTTILATIPTPFIVKYFGTKRLFIWTGFGCAFCHGMLAVYFFLLEGGYDVQHINITPVVVTFIFMVLTCVGQTGVTWSVVSDLFAPSVKGMALAICGIVSTFFGFVAIEVFGTTVSLYGYGATFMGFGIVLFVSGFGFCFVPNTTHMELHEIQEYFEGKKTEPDGNTFTFPRSE